MAKSTGQGFSANTDRDCAVMNPQIKYREIKPGDATAVSRFISAVFNQYVAPGFSQEGTDEFMKYIQPGAIESQLREDHFGFAAALGAELVGAIEVRGNSHIVFFFVEGSLQGKGIGKTLLRQALGLCKRDQADLSEITVNASPNATAAYEAFGFEPTGAEQLKNGIRFVPMALRV